MERLVQVAWVRWTKVGRAHAPSKIFVAKRRFERPTPSCRSRVAQHTCSDGMLRKRSNGRRANVGFTTRIHGQHAQWAEKQQPSRRGDSATRHRKTSSEKSRRYRYEASGVASAPGEFATGPGRTRRCNTSTRSDLSRRRARRGESTRWPVELRPTRTHSATDAAEDDLGRSRSELPFPDRRVARNGESARGRLAKFTQTLAKPARTAHFVVAGDSLMRQRPTVLLQQFQRQFMPCAVFRTLRHAGLLHPRCVGAPFEKSHSNATRERSK